jgi:hypothetical protein
MATRTRPAPGPLAALPPELYALLDGPSIMFVATRSADLEPRSTLVFGLRVADGGREVTVFVPATLAPVVFDNLRDNGEMAINIVRPTDHRAVQLKGTWLGERRTDDSDRAYLERYRDAMTQEMGLVGVPSSIWRRVRWWPTVAMRMEVRDSFLQTPGPSAGRRCEIAPGKS